MSALFVFLAAYAISLSHAHTSARTSVQNFRVYSYQELTPLVDRLFGRDRAGFANIFCRHDAAEVFFVDARYPEFDGISFHFPSEEACADAKAKIRASYRKCNTAVQLDTTQRSAKVIISNCR